MAAVRWGVPNGMRRFCRGGEVGRLATFVLAW